MVITMQNPLPKDEWSILNPLVGTTMLELGNKKNPDGVYKKYFESIGIEHISIDWNGQDGALKLDLRKPLDLNQQFDMLTNFGTTEHVSDQAAVWENIHNLIKIGGVLISMTPLEGDWWWHGEYYPRKEFFYEFAKTGYEIERLYIDRIMPNRNLYARLIKQKHNSFIMPPNETIFYNERRPR